MAQNETINSSETSITSKNGNKANFTAKIRKRDILYKVNFMAQNMYCVTRDSIKPYRKQAIFFCKRDVTGPSV